MKLFRKLLLPLFAFMAVMGLTLATTSPAWATVDAANTYLYRFFPQPPVGQYYKTAESNVYIEQTNDSTGYFYMHGFWLAGGDSYGGYFGLQTRLDRENDGGNDGRGIIFSIWGATAANPASGVTAISGTELGHAYKSLRYAANWVVNHNYDLLVEHAVDFNGNFTGYVNATLTDTTNSPNTSIYLGSLQVANGVTGFYNPGSSGAAVNDLTEQYTPASYAQCTDIAVSKAVWWHNAYMRRTDNTLVAYNADTGYIQSGTGCSNSATNYISNGDWREIVGATS